MDYVVVGLSLLLGGLYIVCAIAEFLLSLFDKSSSAQTRPEIVQAHTQESNSMDAPRAESAEPVADSGRQTNELRKPGILIAEDHRLYRRILERWFRDQGFTVWAAQDGQEAVEMHRANSTNIALVLLDVHMPCLDGPGTLVALQKEKPSIPCCFMTASLDANQAATLVALGASHVFEKPILLQEATAVIRGLVEKANIDIGGYPDSPWRW